MLIWGMRRSTPLIMYLCLWLLTSSLISWGHCATVVTSLSISLEFLREENELPPYGLTVIFNCLKLKQMSLQDGFVKDTNSVYKHKYLKFIRIFCFGFNAQIQWLYTNIQKTENEYRPQQMIRREESWMFDIALNFLSYKSFFYKYNF